MRAFNVYSLLNIIKDTVRLPYLVTLICFFAIKPEYSNAQAAEYNFIRALLDIEKSSNNNPSQERGHALAQLYKIKKADTTGKEEIQAATIKIVETFFIYDFHAAFYALQNIEQSEDVNWIIQQLSDSNQHLLNLAQESYLKQSTLLCQSCPAPGTGTDGAWSALLDIYTNMFHYMNAHINAELEKILNLYKAQSYTEAFQLLYNLRDFKHASVQATLGDFYFNGSGTVSSDTMAFKFFKNAATLQSAYAQSMLSYCYSFGIGTTVNDRSAFQYHQAALAQADPVAVQIEALIENGKGQGQSTFEKATSSAGNRRVTLLESAALQYNLPAIHALLQLDNTQIPDMEKLFWAIIGASIRDASSIQYYNTLLPIVAAKYPFYATLPFQHLQLHQVAYDLGKTYDTSQGDYTKALHWYQLAEQLGNKTCYYDIGKIFYVHKELKDVDKAKLYLQKAIANGHQEAQLLLDKL